MSDDVIQRLSVEGVDPLALAGVNDANLLELARRLGVRVSLRGDTLSIAGSAAAIERAGTVAQALIDLARMGENLDVHDVERVVADEAQGALAEGRQAGPPPPDPGRTFCRGFGAGFNRKTRASAGTPPPIPITTTSSGSGPPAPAKPISPGARPVRGPP